MLTSHLSANMHSHAIACFSYFVPVGSQSFFVHLNNFIATLFKLASTTTRLCTATIRAVLDQGRQCCPRGDTFAKDIVLNKDTDIKSHHYGSGKSHGLERDANGNRPKSSIGVYGEKTIDSDQEDEYEDFADKTSTKWNLREYATAELDVLTVRFGGDLLDVLLGPPKEKLWSTDWLQHEWDLGFGRHGRSAGCIEAIEPHLATLVPYLINTLSDPKVIIFLDAIVALLGLLIILFAAACLLHHLLDTGPLCEFDDTADLGGAQGPLLQMVLDNNKHVQEAGYSVFATLEETQDSSLRPHDMLILYDAVGTLADAAGCVLGAAESEIC
ncbi:hypothetical protein B0H19DRAFT_1248086 [Mycena capillaripes]|nr:hypothetical protein B0H19DRAFT_1248086 [Mycena capillaripes]